MEDKETLEEAAKNYQEINGGAYSMELDTAFESGAEWQQKRMYSEEDVLEIIRQYALEEHLITSSKPDIWFKQFKK